MYRGDGLNLYAYCGNNPVVYYDPSGYASAEAGGACDDKGDTFAEKKKDTTDGTSTYSSETELFLPEKYYEKLDSKKAVSTQGRVSTPIPPRVTYEGNIYRNVNSAFNPLEMNEYTINSNHRYTQPGTPGLYFSSGEKIVYAELGNYDVTDFTNRTMYSHDVKLDNMLDVSNPNIRNNLGVDLSDLLIDDYRSSIGSAITHQVGEYAFENKYAGIIAPSARADGGVNIILFNSNKIK